MLIAAAPSPSPSLDAVLAKPPSSDFSPLTGGIFRGPFTAHDWAINATDASAEETEATLKRNGFVQGYSLVWVSTTQRRALAEVMMAFTGGAGARRSLNALEIGEKLDPAYQHASTMAGIDPYFGSHLYYHSNKLYQDGFSFVKGNDLFQVYFASPNDDNLDLATRQSKSQYASAPDSTIPSAQWPENARSASSYTPGFTAVEVFGVLIVGVIVLGAIGIVVGVILRGRRRAIAQASNAVEMSPDGNYWYDGQAWRDASLDVPPAALRSGDGALWWDGRGWRPVPQARQL